MLIILHWNLGCNGKILPCNESVQSKVCFLKEDYVPTNSPQPLPTLIDIIIQVKDIIEVNEEEQTVELSLRAILDWHDSRLSVNQSKEDIDLSLIHI